MTVSSPRDAGALFASSSSALPLFTSTLVKSMALTFPCTVSLLATLSLGASSSGSLSLMIELFSTLLLPARLVPPSTGGEKEGSAGGREGLEDGSDFESDGGGRKGSGGGRPLDGWR
mmetsp:Transcript_30151/g.97023  ORF Transcript_30151/g.97023 Transcript_30151/m.97023 type:complete len:117 (+) Transcript_30151:2026-2376(+)